MFLRAYVAADDSIRPAVATAAAAAAQQQQRARYSSSKCRVECDALGFEHLHVQHVIIPYAQRSTVQVLGTA
jgi:hypothetical protein